MSGDGGDDGDDGDVKQEYVKKEFVARPYSSDTGVLKMVEDSIIKDSRPLLEMRISKARREFMNEGINFIDKDGSENFYDLKGVTKNISYMAHKKILETGL